MKSRFSPDQETARSKKATFEPLEQAITTILNVQKTPSNYTWLSSLTANNYLTHVDFELMMLNVSWVEMGKVGKWSFPFPPGTGTRNFVPDFFPTLGKFFRRSRRELSRDFPGFADFTWRLTQNLQYPKTKFFQFWDPKDQLFPLFGTQKTNFFHCGKLHVWSLRFYGAIPL